MTILYSTYPMSCVVQIIKWLLISQWKVSLPHGCNLLVHNFFPFASTDQLVTGECILLSTYVLSLVFAVIDVSFFGFFENLISLIFHNIFGLLIVLQNREPFLIRSCIDSWLLLGVLSQGQVTLLEIWSLDLMVSIHTV
jgi:hypothetical protein